MEHIKFKSPGSGTPAAWNNNATFNASTTIRATIGLALVLLGRSYARRVPVVA